MLELYRLATENGSVTSVNFVFSINLSGLQYIIKKQGILDNLMQVIRGKWLIRFIFCRVD